MTQDQLDLLHGYLSGTLSEEDFAHLQDLLREDADARRTLRSLSTVETKLHQIAMANPDTIALLAIPASPGNVRVRWFSGRPAAAATIGLLTGLLGASVAWATALPWLAEVRQSVKSVFLDGFERDESRTRPGLPTATGSWSGDEAQTLSSFPGLKPLGGTKMLRVLRATHAGENSPRSQWGDLYALVDVRGVTGPGRTSARVSANFAAAAAEGKQFSCSVEAFALNEELSHLPAQMDLAWLRLNSSASGSRKEPLSAERTWQNLSIEVPLTHQTKFVMLHLAVLQEQPILQAGTVEFPAHFVDEVRVEAVAAR